MPGISAVSQPVRTGTTPRSCAAFHRSKPKPAPRKANVGAATAMTSTATVIQILPLTPSWRGTGGGSPEGRRRLPPPPGPLGGVMLRLPEAPASSVAVATATARPSPACTGRDHACPGEVLKVIARVWSLMTRRHCRHRAGSHRASPQAAPDRQHTAAPACRKPPGRPRSGKTPPHALQDDLHPRPATETMVPSHAGPGRSGTRPPAGGRPKPSGRAGAPGGVGCCRGGLLDPDGGLTSLPRRPLAVRCRGRDPPRDVLRAAGRASGGRAPAALPGAPGGGVTGPARAHVPDPARRADRR